YTQAVELAPDSASQRIHLGEFLHSQNRRDEALATWNGIAEGPRRDPRNLKALADVLSDFNYPKEAIDALNAAHILAPNDLGLVLQLADLQRAAGKFPAAREVLEAGSRLARDPEQAEQVLTRQIQLEQAAGALDERAAAVEKAVATGQSTSGDAWYRLARYREA